MDGTAVSAGCRIDQGNVSASIWLSNDGHDWENVWRDPDSRESCIAALAATAAGLIAAGRDGGEAAVWRSGDGRTWQRIHSDVFRSAGTLLIRAVVPFRGGVVAVGVHFPDSFPEVGPLPVAWWLAP
jgi:hypothetical protein